MPATHENAGISSWRFNLKAEIHSYEEALNFLDPDASVPRRIGKVLGPNMTVVVSEAGEDVLAVKLYDTEIIRYYPDGTFSVDNGGFNTPTTMYRLNAVLPEGWAANHHRKQLALRRSGGKWLEFWPCTHERRIK